MPGDDDCDVIPGSRRPDGTLRKEIRVRKGYVPPEQQQRFETKGTRFRDSQVPGFVPGMDPADLAGAKVAPKSKNTRRNENRRKKKEDGGEDSEDDGVEEVSGAIASAKLSETPAPPAEADPKEAGEKKIRNLKKKLRQSDDLKAKVDAGEVVASDEQKDKLAKRGEVEAEIAVLEAQLKSL